MATSPRFRRRLRSLICGCALALPLFPHNALAEPGRCHISAEEVYRQVEPKVMEIFADAINPYRVRNRIQFSLGTAFLFGEGILVTNYHVIADAQRVAAFDGQYYWESRIMGVDPLLDIAVLRIDHPDTTNAPLAIAAPDSIAIGQQVFAMGYPRGIGKTITQGLVTGMGRVMQETTSGWLSPFLQTDAAVNPGNSGGPLLDDCARVIGMVTSMADPNLNENTAFAIPVDVLKPVVDEIVAKGRVSRAWHGLYGQMVEPPVLALLGVPYERWLEYTGFLVETIEPGSAAERIGLRGGDWPVNLGGRDMLIGGDIITEVNGTRILDRETALAVVRALQVGETVDIVYKRGDQTLRASITLEERPILEADLDRYRGKGN